MKNIFLGLLLSFSFNAAQADSATTQDLQGTWVAGDMYTFESKVTIKDDQLTWTLSAPQCLKMSADEKSCLYMVTHHFINAGTFSLVADSTKVDGAKILQVKFHGIGNPFFGPLAEKNADDADIISLVANTTATDFELDVLLLLEENRLYFGDLKTNLEEAKEDSYVIKDFPYIKL